MSVVPPERPARPPLPSRALDRALFVALALHPLVLAVAGVVAGRPSVVVTLALLLFGLTVAGAAILWWRRAAVWTARRARAVRLAEASFEEAERLKSELVAVVSHEFRTPLTSIRGYARTLERRGDRMDRETLVASLQAIDGQSRRLERLVENVLVAGVPARPEPDASTALEGVVATVLATLDRDGERRERIVVDLEPGVAVRMNPASAAHVLENLLDNALKFGHANSDIRLSARRDAGVVRLTVVDRGEPIPERVLERIFDPFVQGDSSDVRPVEGIGLGLAAVRRIVRAHGGDVTARNRPPEVVLEVTLPAAQRAAPGHVVPLPAAATTA